MGEPNQPSADDRRKLMDLAVAEVHIAQCLLKARGTDADLKAQFPEGYAAILRAVARKLETNAETRHAIYQLLNCAPEEQP